jgi:hypothetical protein
MQQPEVLIPCALGSKMIAYNYLMSQQAAQKGNKNEMRNALKA